MLIEDDLQEQGLKIEVRKVRGNGFDMPIHPLQSVSWFVFVYNILEFFFISMVSFSTSKAIVVSCSILYGLLSISVLYYGFKVTKCDPSDPTIKR